MQWQFMSFRTRDSVKPYAINEIILLIDHMYGDYSVPIWTEAGEIAYSM